MWRRMMSTWPGMVIGPYDAFAPLPGVTLRALRGQLVDEAVVDLVGRVDALDADAGLAGVAHAAPERGVGGGLHVGVVVDDHRVLAAALHEHRHEVLGAGGHDLLAGARPSR